MMHRATHGFQDGFRLRNHSHVTTNEIDKLSGLGLRPGACDGSIEERDSVRTARIV